MLLVGDGVGHPHTAGYSARPGISHPPKDVGASVVNGAGVATGDGVAKVPIYIGYIFIIVCKDIYVL